MKNKILSAFVSAVMISTLSLSASAATAPNNTDVDTFQPTTGNKVQASPLAQKMENAAKNMYEGNKKTEKTQNNKQDKQNQPKDMPGKQ